MSEELIKRLRTVARDEERAWGDEDEVVILLREAADALSRPAPVQVPEGVALVSRDEAIRVLEGVANIVHVCWSEWGAAGSWSDYDQSVMDGMHALQATLAAAPSAPAAPAVDAEKIMALVEEFGNLRYDAAWDSQAGRYKLAKDSSAKADELHAQIRALLASPAIANQEVRDGR